MHFHRIAAAGTLLAALSVSHSAQALPMCPGGVYYQGECVSVSAVVTDSVDLHALVGPGLGQTGGPGKTGPTKAIAQNPDLRKDVIAIQETMRNPVYPKLVAARDIAGLAGLFGRRGITIAPAGQFEVLMCKPPYGGVLTWGWHKVVTPNGTFMVVGEYCGAGTMGSQTG